MGVAVVAIAAMTLIAAGATGATSMAMLGLLVAGIALPGVARRGRGRRRRRVRRRVGDPQAVSGVWRQLLAAAWAARDQFATIVEDADGSVLLERLAGHMVHVDAALARCGELARDGELLAQQLRGYHVRRLRRDLRSERARHPTGDRAQLLAEQIAEADRLAAHIRTLHDRLEAQVHDLRSAAWRAAALRTERAGHVGSAVEDLLVDLEHLQDAVATVEDLERSATVVDTRHAGTTRPAARVGRRYDV